MTKNGSKVEETEDKDLSGKCSELISRLERLEKQLVDVKETQKLVNKQTLQLAALITKRAIIIHNLEVAKLTRSGIARALSAATGVSLQADDIDDFQRMGDNKGDPMKIIFDTTQKKNMLLEKKDKLLESELKIEDYNPIDFYKKEIQDTTESNEKDAA